MGEERTQHFPYPTYLRLEGEKHNNRLRPLCESNRRNSIGLGFSLSITHPNEMARVGSGP